MEKLKVPIKVGQKLNLNIKDITSTGEGVGKVDNFTVFVDKTVPGDKVKIVIDKIKPNYAIGKTLKFITKSNKRIDNTCIFNNNCGGCPYGNLNYAEQLRIKENNLKQCLTRIGGFKDLDILPIIGTNKCNYRNKSQFKVSNNGLGFYKKGSHEIVTINNCEIQSDTINKLIPTLEKIIKKANISIYNEKTNKGLLRGILVRSNKENEVLISFIINGDSLPNQREIINLLKKNPLIISIFLNINKGKGNRILGNKTKVLYKRKDLIETLGNKKFKISPDSFFQVNSDQAEVLYNIIKNFIELSQDDEILDLYCGTGSIGIYVANSDTHLTGIEINKAAIDDAIYNAQLNGLKNSKFYVGKAEEVINKLSLKPTCVILDPPRKGCEKKLLEYLLKLKLNKIVYVSCNPATLARDLKVLSQIYKVKKVQPVDMFPNTGHLETVVLLEKD